MIERNCSTCRFPKEVEEEYVNVALKITPGCKKKVEVTPEILASGCDKYEVDVKKTAMWKLIA